MSTYFEKVSKYQDDETIQLPTRATKYSAGYDLSAAADIVIPPYDFFRTKIQDNLFENKRHKDYFGFLKPMTLDEMAATTKELKSKVVLVPTGIKCHLEDNQYLEVAIRSSVPLKDWIILANGEGIIDADYYNNPDNEGEVFVPIINLSPFAIQIKRGDRIAQAIIKRYETVENDITDKQKERVGGFGSTNV